MLLRNPYTRRYFDYPLDLSYNNIVLDYRIEHDTFFCPYFSQWLVAELESGDVVYIPTGENRNRNVYVVTSFYRTKQVQHPYGVYTINYNDFARENSTIYIQ